MLEACLKEMVKIGSWNIRGLSGPSKQVACKDHTRLKRQDIDGFGNIYYDNITIEKNHPSFYKFNRYIT